MTGEWEVTTKKFQSTPSVGRATRTFDALTRISPISIHALRGEGDPRKAIGDHVDDISIHALRGEGDNDTAEKRNKNRNISIHALRGEGD